MPSLTLKNVPDALLKGLRKRAHKNRRSVNQEAIYTLESVIEPQSREKLTRAEVDAQLAAWKRIAGKWKSDKTLKEEVADIYSARTYGRPVDLES